MSTTEHFKICGSWVERLAVYCFMHVGSVGLNGWWYSFMNVGSISGSLLVKYYILCHFGNKIIFWVLPAFDFDIALWKLSTEFAKTLFYT